MADDVRPSWTFLSFLLDEPTVGAISVRRFVLDVPDPRSLHRPCPILGQSLGISSRPEVRVRLHLYHHYTIGELSGIDSLDLYRVAPQWADGALEKTKRMMGAASYRLSVSFRN